MKTNISWRIEGVTIEEVTQRHFLDDLPEDGTPIRVGLIEVSRIVPKPLDPKPKRKRKPVSRRGHLYLLVSDDETMFKIGVSRDPELRAFALPDAINPKLSMQVAVESGDVFCVERVVHYFFRAHRLDRESGDGRTEWFDMTSFELVVDYLVANAEILGLGEFLPLQQTADEGQ